MTRYLVILLLFTGALGHRWGMYGGMMGGGPANNMECKKLKYMFNKMMDMYMKGELGVICDVDEMRTDAEKFKSCQSQMTIGASKLRSDLVPADAQLSVYLSPTSVSQKEAIVACCDVICDPGTTYTWQPLDGPPVNNYVLRDQFSIDMITEPGTTAEPSMYTLVLLDIDSLPNGQLWAHYVSTDIPGLNIRGQGRRLVDFFPPAVNVNHMLLMYKQTRSISLVSDPSSYGVVDNSGFCPGPAPVTGRCNFNLERLKADLGLTLVGVNWVKPVEVETWKFYARINNLNMPQTSPLVCGNTVCDKSDNELRASCDSSSMDRSTSQQQPLFNYESWWNNRG